MSSSEWEIHKLQGVCTKIGSGATPRGGKETYLEEGPYSLIRSQNVLDFSFSYNGLAYIDDVQARQLANVEIQERDVLLNITGDSVARVCQVPKDLLPARVNQHVSIIRPDFSKLIPEYLKYFLLNPKFKNYMLGLASVGGTRNALTKVMIEDFEIKLPPLPTQRRIADILSALDEKIELNRQTNATLEAIAQAIFKEWFVDFNFPGATGQMVESELGMIPVGWRVGSFLEIANLLSGGTPKTQIPEYWDGQIKWVSAKDVSSSLGTFVLDTERKVTQIGVDNSSTKILPALTTIVTARGTVGSYCILSEPMAMNQTNYGLKAKSNGSDYFVFYSLANLVEHLLQVAYGTIFDTVTTKTFEQSKIIIPPNSIVQSFDQQIGPTMMQILNNLYESSNLTALRDALLPKLMNGEIEVS